MTTKSSNTKFLILIFSSAILRPPKSRKCSPSTIRAPCPCGPHGLITGIARGHHERRKRKADVVIHQRKSIDA